MAAPRPIGSSSSSVRRRGLEDLPPLGYHWPEKVFFSSRHMHAGYVAFFPIHLLFTFSPATSVLSHPCGFPSRTEIFHAPAAMSENGRGAAAITSIRRRATTTPLYFTRGGLAQLCLHPTRAATT
ncbi:hypothetical protein D1007_18128 [Hordeum vulgare]|nr:hypothetical protein D1007_18128 [Hordeum vulgare]